MFSESPTAIAAQGVVALALILTAGWLAYLDPASRGQLEFALVLGIGSAIGFFFSQRSTAAATHAVTNGMSTMAGLIPAGTPGPTGPTGARGKTGETGETGETGAGAPPAC